MKSLFKLAALFVIVAGLNGCVAGKYMSHYALEPEVHGIADIERTRHKADSLMPGSTAWYDSLKEQGVLKDTFIVGHRDFKVHACYVPAKDPATAQGTAIVVHGYGDNHFVFLYLVRMYRDDFNYNVLFPDLQLPERWYYLDMVEASTAHDYVVDDAGTEMWRSFVIRNAQ